MVGEETQVRTVELVPEAAKRQPCLIALSGARIGHIYRLSGLRCVLGRDSSADIQLDDESLSRLHAKLICYENGTVALKDLDSLNGTFVNGERIKVKPLQDGDRIQVGSDLVFKFSFQDFFDLAREAGMAEVAADVLHDIGNLLNSASVSAGIVRDGLRKPWDPLLTRLSERLREAAAEPEAELAEEVGRALETARVRLHDETLELLSQLDEIREALAEQQRRVKSPLFKQALKLDELVAAAIAEHRAAIDAADIKTQIDCEPLPMILLDGWRVARLLGELIARALSVLEGRPSPELIITGEAVNAQRFALRVTDNGPGLGPEERAQLFAYRRCDGRSGCLHRAALAATSMGGHLSARDRGTGSGTTLELELPLEPAGNRPGNGDANGPQSGASRIAGQRS